MSSRTLIAHLSDTHLNPERPKKIAALQAGVAHLLNLPMRPDAVIFTGDLTDNGTPEEYELFQTLTAPLSMPVYVIPGNHDNRAEMLRVFGTPGESPLPGFMQYAVNVGPVRLLMLDTHIPGAGGGRLDEVRLHWLAERLNEAPVQPTLIALHHPPLISGLKVMDSIGLEGAGALRELMARHPQVERILAGHTHMAQTQRFAGSLLMTCPGMDFSLLPDLNEPQKLLVQNQPPMCLLHEWSEETGLLTYTSVIGDYPLETLHDGQGWVG